MIPQLDAHLQVATARALLVEVLHLSASFSGFYAQVRDGRAKLHAAIGFLDVAEILLRGRVVLPPADDRGCPVDVAPGATCPVCGRVA